MKSLILLAIFALSSPAFAAETPTLGDLAPAPALEELQDKYRDFLKHELTRADYCRQSYGDRLGSKTKMQLSCALMKQTLLAELSLRPALWKNRFELETREEVFGMVAGRFVRSPRQPAFAPLSCSIILVAGWSVKHQWLVDGFFELYCDH